MSMDADPTGGDVPSRFQVDFAGRTLLGIYRISTKLAEGGMGAVYLAEDTNLGRRVVVKVPHARFLGEPGFRTRFRREIAELVRLEHPHVVRILSRGEEDEIPFFVLQFLGGGSLEDRSRAKREAPAAAVPWLETIAQTLDYVHGQGVVHRDVKPANILFDEQGHVFLSDFGVVKALERDDDGDKTEVGTGVGSPFYMAPEQAMGGPVTAASDQYALASTLFEVLAGEPPFGRGSLMEVMIKKQKEEPPSLAEACPGLPPSSDAAVRRAMSLDPMQRFPTCAAFAAEYARGLAPATSEPPADPHPSIRLRYVAVLVAAVVVGGVATDWYGLRSAPGGAAPAPGTAAAPALRPASEILVLVEPGAEPRQAFRWTLAAGMTDRFSVDMTQTLKNTLTGQKPYEGTSSREQPMEVRVDSVEADGRTKSAWTLGLTRSVEVKGQRAEIAEAEQKIAVAIGVLHATVASGPLGGALEFQLDPVPGLTGRAEGIVGGLEEWLRSMQMSLPEEPVGVGAVWDVTRVAKVMGVRYQQTISYELTELEGGRLHLKLRGGQNAMPQDFTVPGMPPEIKTTIKLFRTTLAGEVVLDLAKPAPVRIDTTGTVEYEATVVGGDAPPDASIRFDSKFESHLRRD